MGRTIHSWSLGQACEASSILMYCMGYCLVLSGLTMDGRASGWARSLLIVGYNGERKWFLRVLALGVRW